ncbi:unnamed protein product, partial [Durusdinium trenchii]
YEIRIPSRYLTLQHIRLSLSFVRRILRWNRLSFWLLLVGLCRIVLFHETRVPRQLDWMGHGYGLETCPDSWIGLVAMALSSSTEHNLMCHYFSYLAEHRSIVTGDQIPPRHHEEHETNCYTAFRVQSFY